MQVKDLEGQFYRVDLSNFVEPTDAGRPHSGSPAFTPGMTCPSPQRTVMDDSQIELLTNKERLLEEEIAHLQDSGLGAQVAVKKADLDEIRADLKKQYREIW